MSSSEKDGEGGAAGVSLRAAMRRARLTEAERSDVIVDLRAAEIVRLEVLADQLAPAIADLPPDTDLIDCQIVPGHPPRLWIDMLGYVEMAHDKRTYELVNETRAGRQVIFRSESVAAMAAKVTDYIAHRLIERERMASGARPPRIETRDAPEAASVVLPAGENTARFWHTAFAFMLGVVTGIVGMLVLALIVSA